MCTILQFHVFWNGGVLSILLKQNRIAIDFFSYLQWHAITFSRLFFYFNKLFPLLQLVVHYVNIYNHWILTTFLSKIMYSHFYITKRVPYLQSIIFFIQNYVLTFTNIQNVYYCCIPTLFPSKVMDSALTNY